MFSERKGPVDNEWFTAEFFLKNPPGLHERDLPLDDLKYIFFFFSKWSPSVCLPNGEATSFLEV